MDVVHGRFASDPDWAAYATEKGITLPSSDDKCAIESLTAATLDIEAGRKSQSISQREWVDQHPLASVGYGSRVLSVRVRDGASVSVKVSWPDRGRLRQLNSSFGDARTALSLPVLFVTHGGGWIQGTHVSEEQWLLWPVYDRFNVVIVSVEYRLGPEHRFPTWIEDSWDVLQQLLSDSSRFFPSASVKLDPQSILLAGSSAGATISAVLSQRCRDRNINIKGVILNVPVLCDYRHLPYAELRGLNNDMDLSYEQCTTAVLSSGVMKAVWDTAIPSASEGNNALASPLLGRLDGLPPHLVYVAGQDPLRDEGLLYVQRLRDYGVHAQLKVYPGVPHIFAEMHELEATRKFWRDLRDDLAVLLNHQ